jgi:phenylalanyl-tRNA synthetase alpha chain
MAPALEFKDDASQLTPEMLASGSWKGQEFRPYDVNVFVNPAHPAKKHPLQQVIDEIKDIFVGMGFNEIKGDFVESSFWNFDALFTAQDHPVRDLHDTFYLKSPSKVDIPGFKELKGRVGKTHENGWTTGSRGWQYEWDEKETLKPVLRTHTTSVTAKYLSKLKKEDLPQKVFALGRVFRNESVDYKHLPEFHQVEGIVVDESVSFRNLLGILKEFYDEMGFKVRFRPGYFPYTEMSVEPEIYFEPKNEWIELGGAGIFRPEVVKPLLGFDCPVLAWGLGLDRIVTLKLGLDDIRQLYISDLNWLRSVSVV